MFISLTAPNSSESGVVVVNTDHIVKIEPFSTKVSGEPRIVAILILDGKYSSTKTTPTDQIVTSDSFKDVMGKIVKLRCDLC